MLNLKDIQTDYANNRAAFYALCAKCWEKGVSLYINESDFAAHKEYLSNKKGREWLKMGAPCKLFYKNEPLKDFVQKKGFSLKDYARIRSRIYAGWDIEEAIFTPKHDKHPSHNLRRRNVAMVGGKDGQIIIRGGKRANVVSVQRGSVAVWSKFIGKGESDA